MGGAEGRKGEGEELWVGPWGRQVAGRGFDAPGPCLLPLARNEHMAVYARRFAAANTLVFRSSDLLFRWPEVVATLQAVLPVQPGADFSEAARLGDVATKEDTRSRGLAEARAFYAAPRNRVKGFSEEELRYMRKELDPALMARWGYRHPGADADAGSPDQAPASADFTVEPPRRGI